MCIICQSVVLGASVVASLIPGVASEQPKRVEMPVAAPAGAGVSPGISGTSCRKSGVIRSVGQVSYRCSPTKSGLRWKRQPISAPTTTTTASTTTTTAVPTDPVARKVHDVMVLGVVNGRDVSSVIEHIVEPSSDSTRFVDEAKSDAARAARFYSAIGFPLPQRSIVFYSQTGSWLKSSADERRCNQRSAAGIDWTTDSFARGGYAIPGRCDDGSVVVIGGSPRSWGAVGTLNFHHVLPHELFHQWQMTTASDCGPWICGNSDFPRWLYEGTAQFMTRLVFASWNTSRTAQQWHDYWYDRERPDMRSMCVGVGIEAMENVTEAWPGPSWCAYSKGQLAIEVLVANYGGLDTLRRLHTEKTTVGISTFPAHFKRVTGRELSEFYSEVNQYFKTRGWN